jgi:hypothetical protein
MRDLVMRGAAIADAVLAGVHAAFAAPGS